MSDFQSSAWEDLSAPTIVPHGINRHMKNRKCQEFIGKKAVTYCKGLANDKQSRDLSVFFRGSAEEQIWYTDGRKNNNPHGFCAKVLTCRKHVGYYLPRAHTKSRKTRSWRSRKPSMQDPFLPA
ncbi:hypothetical protein [Chromobacterium amazonense]|uniref:hypothetical protein n=1 Tax=Chromobacterium amazonense TaxID=1382803 RepID=UPI0031F67517